MKSLLIAGLLIHAGILFAHDEGHGPKLTDSGKYGGLVSPIVAAKDASQGSKANVIYKAELVRTEELGMKVYFYDKEMKPLDTAKFEKTAKADLEIERKKKMKKTPFELNLQQGVLTGAYPKPSHRPFNIVVALKEGDKDLMVAFNGLD